MLLTRALLALAIYEVWEMFLLETKLLEGGYSSVIERVLSMHEVVGSIPSTSATNKYLIPLLPRKRVSRGCKMSF